jgi:hypothetical protein
MRNISSASVLIRDNEGFILFVIERNKIEFNGNVKVTDEKYYSIGSSLIIQDKEHIITDLQFVYRNLSADFQTIVTVNAA